MRALVCNPGKARQLLAGAQVVIGDVTQDADLPGALDGVRDTANLSLEEEPQRVRDDLEAVCAHRAAA